MADKATATADALDKAKSNHRRLHGELGLVPRVEVEREHYRHNTAMAAVAASVPSLSPVRDTRERAPA